MRRYRLCWLLLGLGCLLMTGCVPKSVTPPWVSRVTMTEEQVLDYSQAAEQRLLQEHGGRLVDDTVQEYLDALLPRISHACALNGSDWRAVVVNNGACDLVAVPGGTLLIYRGLLERMTDEGQLAALLSHAMAHLQGGHAVHAALNSDAFQRQVDPLSGVDETVVRGQQLADFLRGQRYTIAEENDVAQMLSACQTAGVVVPSHCAWAERHPGAPRGVRLAEASVEEDNVTFAIVKTLLETLSAGYEVFERGQQLERQDQLPQAISLYLQAATQANEQGLILTGLGLAYLQVGEVNSAHHYLQRAVRLDGRYYRSHLGLGYVYLQQGKLAEAEEQLERSRALLPTLQGHYLLADLYARREQWAKARTLYRQVADADPQGKLGKAARQALKDLP